MEIENANIAVILFKSKTLSNGEHPVMIRVTKNRIRKYVSLKLSCKEKDWNEEKGEVKKSHQYKDQYNTIILKARKSYNDALVDLKQEGKDFTPDTLIANVTQSVQKITVFQFFEYVIKRLKNRREIGNAKVYTDVFVQLKNYTKKKDITFSQIDYKFLVGFEEFMKAKGLSDNAMSVRFRTIRALFNAAIDENYAKKDLYPFSKFKIAARFSTKTQKRAITRKDIQEIENLVIKKNSSMFEAQQFFLFSFYCQGINFVDIAYLRWENVVDGRVFYKRAKTGTELNFKLLAPALKIIEHWRVTNTPSKNDYIFPILDDKRHITATQKHNRVHKVITRVNKHLKQIAIDAKISTPLTSYVARHTFATFVKHSGVATAVISQSMGHKTEAITQTYLKDFENSIVDKAMECLL